ncbi:unnamed protein product [Brachionus calyciflorus]|uniref:Protein-lysine N-methyltransferase OXX778_LOCUS22331 n=1 Tax=Brachionus calyciflorus TaxID=104777 RepID=A0A814R224_9BILA|nr:unnamed protein product [Brachionus calyciflorus]
MAEELSSSKLGTLEYWEQTYDKEIENFNEFGDEGEVWFGIQTAKRVVNWLKNKQVDKENSSIIDIGCGNGFSCCMLAEAGFKQITGVDYSEKAIKLAKSIAESKNLNIDYKVVDVLNKEENLNSKKYDIAIDKGTYDAIGLCPDDPRTKRYLYKEFLLRVLANDSLFIITSCNWTSKELENFFTESNEFEIVEEIKAPITFQFGGSTGSTTSTLVFKFKKSN